MILNTVIEQLAKNRNRVIFEPHGQRRVFVVDAVMLVTYQSTPQILLFSKQYKSPLTWDGETSFDPEANQSVQMPVVYTADDFNSMVQTYSYRPREDDSLWKSPDDLFAILLTRMGGALEMLEYVSTRPNYPTYSPAEAVDTFDGKTSFLIKGIPHTSRMLITLRPERPLDGLNCHPGNFGGRGDRPVETQQLELGNVLMWSLDTGTIHWVTRTRDGNVVSLGEAGHADDYNQFLQWGRRFSSNGWFVGSVTPMPYYIPKATPAEDPAEEETTEPGSRLWLKVMNDLLRVNAIIPGELSPAAEVLLREVCIRHFPGTSVANRSEEYEQLAGDTILQYSAGKSATIIKALNEAKLLITEAFKKLD